MAKTAQGRAKDLRSPDLFAMIFKNEEGGQAEIVRPAENRAIVRKPAKPWTRTQVYAKIQILPHTLAEKEERLR